MTFKKNHPTYKGIEKGWFKRGDTPWNKGRKLPYTVWNKGRPWPESVKIKIGKSLTGKPAYWNRKPKSDAVKIKLSKISKHHWAVPENREKLKKAIEDLWKDPNYQNKLSKIRRKMWLNPVYKDAQIKKLILGWRMKPNRIEKRFTDFINKSKLPFEYVGDGKVVIGGKIPDFVSTNKKKQIIEIFGDYWHKIKDKTSSRKRIGHFRKFGYKTLILWESELQKTDWQKSILKKIQKFMEGYDE